MVPNFFGSPCIISKRALTDCTPYTGSTSYMARVLDRQTSIMFPCLTSTYNYRNHNQARNKVIQSASSVGPHSQHTTTTDARSECSFTISSKHNFYQRGSISSYASTVIGIGMFICPSVGLSVRSDGHYNYLVSSYFLTTSLKKQL